MKILILGGTGVFGSRLARLLIEDGHDVIVCSRSHDRAKVFTDKYGGTPLALHRNDDPAPHLTSCIAVVDAAGPFQSYGATRYRLARKVLECSVNYIDLSDDADFTVGIAELDGLARTRGVTALSGVSSVPALSSAAVTAMAAGLSEIDVIDTAILPGNRAPRGRSVMSSILGQVGAPLKLWRGGRWTTAAAWTASRQYRLEPGLTRKGALIGAPDLILFPAHFKARSVLFRAGLELRVMQDFLALMAWLRQRRLIPNLERLTPILHGIAGWLERFGTDRGGMIVSLTGTTSGGRRKTRCWRLVAEGGDGPFIPAIPALIVLRKLAAGMIEAGSRPALDVFTLREAEDALARLKITFARDVEDASTLFQSALGEKFMALPQEVQAVHTVFDREVYSGRASVARGKSATAGIIARLFGFPAATPDIAITVTMTRTGDGEIWERNFGGKRFVSHLSAAGPMRFCERFGPFTFELDLQVTNGTLAMPVRRGWFFGIPLPKSCLPRSEATEFAKDGLFHFDVCLSTPFGATIVRYQGWLAADRQDAPVCAETVR